MIKDYFNQLYKNKGDLQTGNDANPVTHYEDIPFLNFIF